MKITEVRIKLPESWEDRKLLAYCDLVLDGSFAVHNIKLVQGASGLILSMPSQIVRDHCPSCEARCDVTAFYCSMCGVGLHPCSGANRRRSDVFHPISSGARHWLHEEVVSAYRAKVRDVTSGLR